MLRADAYTLHRAGALAAVCARARTAHAAASGAAAFAAQGVAAPFRPKALKAKATMPPSFDIINVAGSALSTGPRARFLI